MTDKEKPTIDVDAMRDSWLKALSEGHAEGFSRHFVPDILDEIERLSCANHPRHCLKECLLCRLAEAERKLAVAATALEKIAAGSCDCFDGGNIDGGCNRIADKALSAISSPAPDPDEVEREAARTAVIEAARHPELHGCCECSRDDGFKALEEAVKTLDKIEGKEAVR